MEGHGERLRLRRAGIRARSEGTQAHPAAGYAGVGPAEGGNDGAWRKLVLAIGASSSDDIDILSAAAEALA